MSLDAAMAPGNVYRGFQEEDLNPAEPHTIWQRTKGLFVPQTRSHRSSTVGSVQSNSSNIRGSAAAMEKPADIQRPQNTVRARNSSLSGMASTSYADHSHSPNYTVHRDWAYFSSGSGYATDISPSHPMIPPTIPAAKDCSSSTKSAKSGLRVTAREPGRQFSFQSIFHKTHRRDESGESSYSSRKPVPKSPHGDGFSAVATSSHHEKTEEELLGLVTGDKPSRSDTLPLYADTPSDDDSDIDGVRPVRTGATLSTNDGDDEKSGWDQDTSGAAGTSNSGRSTIRML